MRIRALLGVLVLVVLAGAFLLGRGGGSPAEAVGVQASQPDPGYVALGAEIVETSDDGTPLYSLNADRIEQQPATGDVTLQTITMQYQRDPGTRWQLQARHGQLAGGTTVVRLIGDVHATGELPGSKIPADFRSEQLDFDTRSQDLSTHQLVTIYVGRQRLVARGLMANLKQDRVRLESAVHGRYSPR
jgi:LPS export ABC transporter protein LptC